DAVVGVFRRGEGRPGECEGKGGRGDDAFHDVTPVPVLPTLPAFGKTMPVRMRRFRNRAACRAAARELRFIK
ncbi:MAG: hypothetical protein ACU0CN_02335, partial [Pseudooceanicola nanhaiensis]|uniref:hypothetical protein n=1 Tax=Pseudooceanicola nanhaiensis TaxID=375761 RepID=UPI004058DFFC